MCTVNTISNNKIKEIKKLHLKKYRDELNLFLAEGEKAVLECIEAGLNIKEIYALNNYDGQVKPVCYINEETMKKICTTDSVCKILAVAEKRSYDLNKFKKLNKIALLDAISDAGNLGTIIRSAAAFGIEGIILYGDCTDVYSPKVVRSCAGNLFKIPVIEIREAIKELFPSHTIIATALSKDNNITPDECSKLNKYIIMLGSEAKGLRESLIKIADKNIRLNMEKSVESLNLAVSASVIFYELYK